MRQDVCNNGRDGLTWEQLVAAEPRLASLLEEVRAAGLDDGDEFDLEGVWGRFKDRIAGLVGWHRRQGEPLLQTEAAYRARTKDILNCCAKMPSLRRAGLPGSSNLPKQLPMSPSPTRCGILGACLSVRSVADSAPLFRRGDIGTAETECHGESSWFGPSALCRHVQDEIANGVSVRVEKLPARAALGSVAIFS